LGRVQFSFYLPGFMLNIRAAISRLDYKKRV
jgi:hypothetical protein